MSLLFPLVSLAFHLTSQMWRRHKITKYWILRILAKKTKQNKQKQTNFKNPRIKRFWWDFWLIVKGNDYFNIERNFQLHSSNLFVLEVKANNLRWQPPKLLTLTAYPTPGYGSKIVKMTGKDDPTNFCCHFMVELSGLKITLTLIHPK